MMRGWTGVLLALVSTLLDAASNRADELEVTPVLAGAGPKARAVGAATAARVTRAMGEIFMVLNSVVLKEVMN
jgi:hypothetical protein